MKLSHLLKSENVLLDLPATGREDVLARMAEQLESSGAVRHAGDLVELLLDRERLGATVVGDEAAIPHCKVPGLKAIVTAFARTVEAITFGAGEQAKARLFFVLSPREQPAAHLQVLANIARLLRNPAARQALLDAATAGDLLAALARLEAV